MSKDSPTYEELMEKYNNSTDAEKVEILWLALGYMEMYNGNTMHDTVIQAMGGTMHTIDDYHAKD